MRQTQYKDFSLKDFYNNSNHFGLKIIDKYGWNKLWFYVFLATCNMM
jgi:hypothetical protein